MILWFFVGSIVVLVAFFAYACYVVADCWHTTKSAPVVDMLVCDRHGMFPKKYALAMLEGDYVTGQNADGTNRYGPIHTCPMCFEARIKEAAANK